MDESKKEDIHKLDTVGHLKRFIENLPDDMPTRLVDIGHNSFTKTHDLMPEVMNYEVEGEADIKTLFFQFVGKL